MLGKKTPKHPPVLGCPETATFEAIIPQNLFCMVSSQMAVTHHAVTFNVTVD